MANAYPLPSKPATRSLLSGRPATARAGNSWQPNSSDTRSELPLARCVSHRCRTPWLEFSICQCSATSSAAEGSRSDRSTAAPVLCNAKLYCNAPAAPPAGLSLPFALLLLGLLHATGTECCCKPLPVKGRSVSQRSMLLAGGGLSWGCVFTDGLHWRVLSLLLRYYVAPCGRKACARPTHLCITGMHGHFICTLPQVVKRPLHALPDHSGCMLALGRSTESHWRWTYPQKLPSLCSCHEALSHAPLFVDAVRMRASCPRDICVRCVW